jgi:hypothetical protein
MKDDRKRMETGIAHKRKVLGENTKVLKKNQTEKKKIDLPVSVEVKNILLRYNISAAAYHGGRLNGVDCRELIHL